MKQNIKVIIALAISVLFVACNNDIDDVNHAGDNDQGTEPNIVLQERDPQLPVAMSADTFPLLKSDPSGEKGNTDALLGRAYRLIDGNFILGDYLNVQAEVINLEAIKAYDKSYIVGKQLLSTETSSFAYSNFDRYQYNSTVSKKVKTGFSLNFKVFSFGKKKTTTEVYKSAIDNTAKQTYGEMSIDFKKSSFSLQVSEGSRRLYSRQFLTRSFTRSLYGSTIASTFETYGDFVLVGYHTGGKAYALYMGQTNDNLSSESYEKDITKKIDASIKWKGNSASGNMGFEGSNGNSTTNTFKDEQTFVYIKTIGGVRDGSEAELKAVRYDSLKVNLTSWMRSLNDVANITMVDLADQGLYPISDFVLETNFKQRFDDTFSGVLEKKTQLIKPYVEIVRVLVRSTASYESLYDVAAVLVTRQGDRIILSDGKASSASDAQLRENEDKTIFLQKVQKIKDEKSQFFSSKIEISYNPKTKLNPVLRSPLCIDLTGFKEQNFYKFFYEKTNMAYIYDPSTRLCFSYFSDEGDNQILEIYGIKEWVESLPEKNISIASLANSYKIIGL